MSPCPQLSAVERLLTNRSFPPRSGVGQKSFAAELMGAGSFSGAPNGSPTLSRVATQMFRSGVLSPALSGVLYAMWSWRLSGDRIGHPSSEVVLSSELLPAISSTFWPVLQVPAGAATPGPAPGRGNPAANVKLGLARSP